VKSVIESSKPGIGAGSAWIVTVVSTVLKLLLAASGLTVSPSVSESFPLSITAGIVTSSAWSPGPSPNGKPPKPFHRITAPAPASWAKKTLVVPSQSPDPVEPLKISAM
jgi:hypothetical protein